MDAIVVKPVSGGDEDDVMIKQGMCVLKRGKNW